LNNENKPTSNMVAKYKLNEIVLTPYPAESDRKDVNISQGEVIKLAHSRESGYFYQVLLPVETGNS
jgi:hypothetical protein